MENKSNKMYLKFLFIGMLISMSGYSQMLVNFNLSQPPLPDAGFEFQVQPDGLQFDFSDISTTNVVSWYWDFGDGSTSILQNPEHTYSVAGIYQVCLAIVNENGCQDSACNEVNSFTVSINKYGSADHYSIYPNPFTISPVVQLNIEKRSRIAIALFNLTGEKISDLVSAVLEPGTRTFEFKSEMSNLKSGIYFMKISIDDLVYMERIVKNP